MEFTDRFAKPEALDRSIARCAKEQTAQALMYALQALHVPAVVTNKASGLVKDAHLDEVGYWQWMYRAVVGNRPNPSPPFRVNAQRIKIGKPASTLGQHSHEILVEELGIS